MQHSHLFKNPDMLVSTFQRVDLPVVPILDQYTYVLYTDADVYFRRPIHLDDFGECCQHVALLRALSCMHHIQLHAPDEYE